MKFSVSRRAAAYAVLIAAVIAVDRWTKLLARRHLAADGPLELARWLCFSYVENTGAAFGLLRGMNWALAVFAAAMLAGLFLYRKRIEESGGALAAAGLALVAGGALGNLWDRIAYGAVTDFIDFRVWPVFNAADSFISVGAALMAFAFCFNGADKPPSEETK